MVYHIFHHDDADGYASAAVLNRYYLNEILLQNPDDTCIYHSCNHNYPMPLEEINEGDTLFILDYSFSREDDQLILQRYYESGLRVIWIDHHDSSLKIAKNGPFDKIASEGLIYTTNEYSACALVYFWCMLQRKNIKIGLVSLLMSNNDIITNPGDLISSQLLTNLFKEYYVSMPEWIKLVSDHDTFNHQIPYSAEFCTGVYHHGLNDVFLNSELTTYSDDNYPEKQENERYICDGKLLTEYQNKQYNRILKGNAFSCKIKTDLSIKDHQIICLNGYGNSFAFGDSYNDYDAVIIFNFDGEYWRYSMYSKDDGLDICGDIATFFNQYYKINGGGHKHAAGWSTKELIFKPETSQVFMLNNDVSENIKIKRIEIRGIQKLNFSV